MSKREKALASARKQKNQKGRRGPPTAPQASPAPQNLGPAPSQPSLDAEDSANFDALLDDVLKNPDILLDEKRLTDEQVMQLQKRLNPYASLAGPRPVEGRKKVAVVSYTNLREDYLRRLTMTSLVGFLFQVYHEWEVPAPQRRWTPAAADTESRAPYDPDRLVDELEAALAVAQEARTAGKEAAEAKRAAAEQDLLQTLSAADIEAKYATANLAAAKAAGLLYAATHGAHRIGATAGVRLRATAEEALKFPEVKAAISRFPLPPEPGTQEMPAETAKEVIGSFLRHWLAFDPCVHVRSAHDAKTIAEAAEKVRVGSKEVSVDTKDPGHLTVEALRDEAPQPAPEHWTAYTQIVSHGDSGRAAALALLRDEDACEAGLATYDAFSEICPEKSAREAVAGLFRYEGLAASMRTATSDEEARQAFLHYLAPVRSGSGVRPAADHVPPQDTFHRWNYYTEVNYEELRTVTEALYPERPDLDQAVALWEVYEGTQAEVDAAFEKHCQRYAEETTSSLKALEFGQWSMLADFKENRKKVQFFNKNTEVLKRILDRHANDKKMGAEMMRDRIRHMKAANIAKEGPDDKGLGAYKSGLANKRQDLSSLGVERVISQEEMLRLEKAKGDLQAAKELEVLEQYEKTIAVLGEKEALLMAAGKTLPEFEAQELLHARENIGRAREMAAVPNDAIQIDIFTNDPNAGTFTKSHFYSAAVAPEHLAKDPVQGGHHPAVRSQELSRELAEAEGQSAGVATRVQSPALADTKWDPNKVPVFAPYALDYMAAADRRTEADMHAEAQNDATDGQ